MSLLQSWRWYGAQDPVTLNDVRQAGAHIVVNALHEIPVGEIWPIEAIKQRQKLIEWDDGSSQPTGLKWSVVESVNVHESIKRGDSDRDVYIEYYIETLRHLSQCGIYTVCYNFMPVLDWTRTDLEYKMLDGSCALRYDATALVAFDLFILRREGAEREYPEEIVIKARQLFDSMSSDERDLLQRNILAGLPGTKDTLGIDTFRNALKAYRDIDRQQLKNNLIFFLEKVIPIAETLGIKMCIHPDDPPFQLFGLPRVVSTEEDLRFLTSQVDSASNGITFCTGSLAPNPDNDLAGMVERLGSKFHFVHLRNIQRQEEGSFYESDHLDGSVDMYAVMKAIVQEDQRREQTETNYIGIPFRPDHGHQMLDDLQQSLPFPGYSAIGRLRGLAELRGLELGIRKSILK